MSSRPISFTALAVSSGVWKAGKIAAIEALISASIAGPSASTATRRSGVDRLPKPGLGAQEVGLVRLLPREVVVVAAEVAVRRGLLVDRPVQVEVVAERARTQ